MKYLAAAALLRPACHANHLNVPCNYLQPLQDAADCVARLQIQGGDLVGLDEKLHPGASFASAAAARRICSLTKQPFARMQRLGVCLCSLGCAVAAKSKETKLAVAAAGLSELWQASEHDQLLGARTAHRQHAAQGSVPFQTYDDSCSRLSAGTAPGLPKAPVSAYKSTHQQQRALTGLRSNHNVA